MHGLRNHLVGRDQKSRPKSGQVDTDIKHMSDDAKARHISLQPRVVNLKESARRTPTTTTEDVPPRSQSVVVFGSWPGGTERSRIINGDKTILDVHGYACKDIYMPAPRHHR